MGLGKRCRESDCDCATAATAEYKTVFVDTNLDTHLAMRASGSETLSDIKAKLVLQHMELFPTAGEIKIHSLKVKRRSNFYHLPDIMLLSNAFEGFNGNWYLYVDASSALNHNELDSVDCVKEKDADDCRGMVSAVKEMGTFTVAPPKDANARNEVSEVASGVQFAKSLEKSSGTFSAENCVETEPPAKKKRKMKHAVDGKSNAETTAANSKLDYVKEKENAVELNSNAGLDCSMTFMNAADVKEDMESDGSKRKEEDSRMAPEIICKTQVEPTGKGVLDAPTVEAPEMGSGSKKKTKKGIKKKNNNMEGVEKSMDAYPENSGTEQSIDGSATDPISEASDKKGSTLHGKGQDVPINLLDGSSKYASEKIQVADKDVVLTQSSQTLDDISSAEKIVKTQSSLSNAIEDFSAVEKELNRGFNQVQKNGKNMEGNNKIAKKRKRVKLSTSDVKTKDSHDILRLSSNVKRLEALPMNLSSNSHEQNQLSSDVKNDQLNSEAKAESVYLNSNRSKEDVVLGDVMPENLVASNLESKHGADSFGVSSNEVPDCNTRLTGDSGLVENVRSNTSKRKKKKSHKLAADIQDNTYIGQTVNVEMTKLHTETLKPEENQDEKSIPLDYNCEVTIPSIKTDLDAAVAESVISCGSKKKRKKTTGGKSADSTLEKLGNEQSINGICGSSGLCASANNIPEAGGNEEDTLPHKDQDVQLKLLDSSTKGASEQVQGAEGNEANLVVSTQNSQISEDVASAYKTVENTQSGQTTENKDKKSKKRRKKALHTVSDVTGNPPDEVQNAAVEVSPTAADPVRSEKEERPVGLSSALSNKSEGNFDKINRTDSNTADHRRTSENEDEGINLKQHHQCQDKDSGNGKKKATKSSSKKIEKVVQKNALLPPASISTKSSDGKGSEDQSCIRKSNGGRPGNSTHKSVQEEIILNSSTVVSGVEVKDSTPSEMHQMEGLQERVQVHASPPCPKDLNVTLNKSSLGRSERRGNKRAQTDAAKKMLMKTPRKKSLLIKPGAIFQDDSGESSGDENEILYSASSFRRPSDGLALFSDSESIGESDLSQESDRNVLDDAKDQSTAVKKAAKLDNLSDSGEVTMDMILRSSKRFKNAKLLASQNEDFEPIEYVPESQLD